MTDTLAPQETLLTVEQFYDQYAGQEGRYELVDGRVIEMPPTGPTHGELSLDLGSKLRAHVKQQDLGRVYTDTGFIFEQFRRHVRGPDLAFVSNERIAASPPPETGFWRTVPDFVIEIISPDDRAADIADKVADYIQVGVRLVWVIYPRRRLVHVFRYADEMEVIGPGTAIHADEVVPGFELTSAELWEAVR